MHGALTTFNIHSSASASVFRLFVFSGYWHKGFENLVAYDQHVVLCIVTAMILNAEMQSGE